LTEAGWKAVALKYKIKDNGLQKALADYEKLPLDGAPLIGYAKFIEVSEKRDKALKEVQRLVGLLLKAKEVADNKDATKYLKDVDAACHSEDLAISKEIAEVKEQEKKAAAAAAKAHPDPKMLSTAFNIGLDDGLNGRSMTA
jgi:hypothetical protein